MQGLLGSAAVASLVLGCAWTLYANVFGANVYPTLSSSNFDAPVIRRSPVLAARSPATIIDSVFAALPEPAPVIAAPAVVASGPSLSFQDRFAAAAPQGEAPKMAEAAKPAETLKIAEAPKPQPAPKLQLASLPPATVAPLPPARPADIKPARSAGAAVKDMAQRAKAAVMSIASSEKLSIIEKLWGKHESRGSLLSFASADASITGSLPSDPKPQNPMLGGSAPYDRQTAVYDITAHVVYLPDGSKLEAHSGLGSKLDDPDSSKIRMHGVTPPHIYELTPREALFHGVPALRLNPDRRRKRDLRPQRIARAHLHARPQRRFQRLRLVQGLQRVPERLPQPGHQAAGGGGTGGVSGYAGFVCAPGIAIIPA